MNIILDRLNSKNIMSAKLWIEDGSRNDPKDKKGMFVAVMVRFKQKLKNPVKLEDIKKNSSLSEIPLIKQSRLSVMPIDSKSWKIILKMSSIQ